MKQCPLCHRTYADDLNFCLEDGKVLRTYGNNEKTVVDDEATLVYPQPIPSPPPPAGPPTPQPLSQGKRWTIGTVIGTIVIVLLWGGLKLAVWSADRAEGNPESTASPSPSLVYAASPSGSAAPPCTVLNNCPSPSPTPQLSPSPVPSPSPSPSPAPTEEIESKLQPGTYQGSFKPNNKPEDELGMRTIKLQFTLNSDGTYFIRGYLTIQMTDWNDKLYSEEKGNYSQEKDQLIFTNRLQRNLNYDTDEWSPWQVPNSGAVARDKMRNQTPTSFQLYVANNWMTVSKL